MTEDLDKLSTEELGKLFPIKISEYNPGWEKQFISKPENPPPHMMFAKGYSAKGYSGQTYHIHVRYRGEWDELIFRDYLLQNPKIAKEYGELKLRLSVDHLNDREKFTENKTDYISKIVRIARAINKNNVIATKTRRYQDSQRLDL